MHPESAAIICVSVRTLNGLVARFEKAKFYMRRVGVNYLLFGIY